MGAVTRSSSGITGFMSSTVAAPASTGSLVGLVSSTGASPLARVLSRVCTADSLSGISDSASRRNWRRVR